MCEIAQKMCGIAHFFAPPKIVFSLIINTLTFWHGFCCIISIRIEKLELTLNMILHYLKVALRNLWKYRTHSLISVLCLAIGITFFTVMSMYVSRVGFYRDQPDYERRVHIKKKVGG